MAFPVLARQSAAKIHRAKSARWSGAGCATDSVHQLKRVTRQRARPQASRKMNMADASARRASQFNAMLGARARTARVTKTDVAAITRSQSSQLLLDRG